MKNYEIQIYYKFVFHSKMKGMMNFMGRIIKDGVIYAGGASNADAINYNNKVSGLDATNVKDALDILATKGGDNAITLTEEEFFALSEEEQNNGLYFITDAEDEFVCDAIDITYDNSFSTLESNTVQEAIDEVVNGVTGLKSDLAELDIGIPEYVIAEAERVLEKVMSVQGSRTINIASLADLHYGHGDYTDGVKNACQALKYIDERIKLDAVTTLGDYTNSYPTENYVEAIADFKGVNKLLANLRFTQNLRLQGNHDFYTKWSPITCRYIQSFSDGVVWGSKLGGYFHKDFADFKLRVICLNTYENDLGGEYIKCTTEQFQWFADKLDLSEKDDMEDWQILILSHHPLDWYTLTSFGEHYVFGNILKAYQDGSSWSYNAITCNYSGKNGAKIICNIHGHIHNFLTGNIHYGETSWEGETNILRMASPESCIYRENAQGYSDKWKEATSYPKTVGTAENTAFCIFCIDLDTYSINAICYGAGYDREVSYENTVVRYTVTNNLTDVSTNNGITSVVEGSSYTATLTPEIGKIKTVTVTMGDSNITSTAYSNGIITIPEVTGDIVITAVAEVNTTTYEVDIETIGYTDNSRWSTSSGEIRTTTTENTAINLIPLERASGETATIKLSGITWVNETTAAILFYVGETYGGSTDYIPFNRAHNYSDTIGAYSIFNDDGTIDVVVADHPSGTMFDGFKVCGAGSGASAEITITIEG